MKNKIKSILILIIISLVAGLFWVIKNEDLKEKSAYLTFQKSKKKISYYPSTKSELKKTKLKTKKKPIKTIVPKERTLMGSNIGSFKKGSKKLEMENKISKNWKKLYGKELLRFQGPDTKVVIKHEKSFIMVINNKGRYIEQVLVSFIKNNKHYSSFRALVNSETGRQFSTFERTLHEHKRPITFSQHRDRD